MSDNMVNINVGFSNGSILFPIDILPDFEVEGDHTFRVMIVGNETFTIGDISEIEVVIIDDDSKLKHC